jgi:hypothetical protein
VLAPTYGIATIVGRGELAELELGGRATGPGSLSDSTATAAVVEALADAAIIAPDCSGASQALAKAKPNALEYASPPRNFERGSLAVFAMLLSCMR